MSYIYFKTSRKIAENMFFKKISETGVRIEKQSKLSEVDAPIRNSISKVYPHYFDLNNVGGGKKSQDKIVTTGSGW